MSVRQIVVIVLVLVVIGAGVVFFVLTPQVEAYSPLQSSGNQPNDAVIEISFSRPMQPESVLEQLSITPAVDGEYTWLTENTLQFIPSAVWPSGAEVEVRLESGSRSQLGLSVRETVAWAFRVSPVQILYLWPAAGGSDVYALDPESGESVQLTFSGDVVGYDTSPNGHLVYFFTENSLGGNDLYRLDRFENTAAENGQSFELERLLTCERTLCTFPVVSPDANLLAYLRNDSEVWLLDLETLDDPVQVSPKGDECRTILWAPDGRLSYYNASEEAYVIRDLESEQQIVLENLSGEAGVWAPGGTAFVAPEAFTIETNILRGPSGEADNEEVDEEELEPVRVLSTHLMVYQTNGSRVEDLSGDQLVEDFSPAFSPDGRLLAFTRRYLVEEPITLGRQIWVLSFSGSGVGVQALPLTDHPDYKYYTIAWHPEGTEFAAVRFNQTLLTEPPEVWLFDLDGNATRLLIGGYDPQWIP